MLTRGAHGNAPPASCAGTAPPAAAAVATAATALAPGATAIVSVVAGNRPSAHASRVRERRPGAIRSARMSMLTSGAAGVVSNPSAPTSMHAHSRTIVERVMGAHHTLESELVVRVLADAQPHLTCGGIGVGKACAHTRLRQRTPGKHRCARRCMARCACAHGDAVGADSRQERVRDQLVKRELRTTTRVTVCVTQKAGGSDSNTRATHDTQKTNGQTKPNDRRQSNDIEKRRQETQ